MEKEINIGNYASLDEGSKTASTYSSNLSDLASQAISQITKLNNESVFMGPACDQSVSAFKSIESSLSTSAGIFQATSATINTVKENYELADTEATKTISETKQ